MLVVNERLQIPLKELHFSFVRSQGPGGQNVNKVNSRAVLRWPALRSPSLPAEVRQRLAQKYARRLTADGELILSSQRFRDQGRNVADCLARLRTLLIEVASPPRPRKATRPTRSSKERRLREKRAQSLRKQSRRPPGDT